MAGKTWIRRGMALGFALTCAVAVGCTTAPSQPSNQLRTKPTPKPAAPFVSTTTTLDFSGEAPAPFEDPTTTDERYTGRYSAGRWVANNGEYRQTQEASGATLMFQRYNGNAFQQDNGNAPSKYQFEATAMAYKAVTASESVMAGAPVGIVSYVPYYLDSTHYIIVERVKDQNQVWFVDGLTPGDEWNADTYMKFNAQATSSIKVGEPVTFKSEIDTKAGTMKLWINGEMQTILQDPKFIRDVQHSVALLSNGNYMSFKNVKLTPLSAE